MSKNQGSRATTTLPKLRSEPPAQPNHLEAGSPQLAPTLTSYRIVSVFLEGKDIVFEGDDTSHGIWELPSMMAGWLRFTLDGLNHDVWFVTIPSRESERTNYLAEGLEITEGSELNTWLDEQVDRLWAERTR